jgi:hypothetical protein
MLRDGIEEKQFNQENDSKLKKIAIKRMIQFLLKKNNNIKPPGMK